MAEQTITKTPTRPDADRFGPLQHPKRSDAPVLDWIGAALRYLTLILLTILFLFPFYLMIRNALSTQAEITSFEWVWWPEKIQWSNWNALFDSTQVDMTIGLRNSVIIAVVNFIFQTLFASMAGYALARIPFRGAGVFFAIILVTLMVPAAVTFVPTFVVVSAMGGVNTVWGIVVPGLFNAFATFLFRQFYLDFPTEIEEAGRLDGLSYFGVYWRMLLPNSIGIMAALGVLSFIASWNAFLWPSIIGQTPGSRTVQVVLSAFLTAQTINLPALFMGAVVGAAPLVIVFLLLQRYIVQGVRMSGIKG
ncbi:MAG TPA: carbohydrate ABC transporter permease [Thermomicrobiales bacterium]|nr:carbohydrate ABC transporter permease [Thermomicrobiales bacterium]